MGALFLGVVALAWGVRRLAGRLSQAGPSERVAIWQRVGAWVLIGLGCLVGVSGTSEIANSTPYLRSYTLGSIVVLGVAPVVVGYYWLMRRPAAGIALAGVALLSYLLLFLPVRLSGLGEGAHLIGIIGAVLLVAGLLHAVEGWRGPR